MQKAVIVTGYWNVDGEWNDSLDELNEFLSDGWAIKHISAMGAFGYGYTGFGYCNYTGGAGTAQSQFNNPYSQITKR